MKLMKWIDGIAEALRGKEDKPKAPERPYRVNAAGLAQLGADMEQG